MSENIVKREFIAEGTVCSSCSEIIKRQAQKIDGVKEVEFDYATESGWVRYDSEKTNLDKILYRIEEKGYKCYSVGEDASVSKSVSSKKILGSKGWFFGIIGLLVIVYFIFNYVDSISIPQISQNMGYGLLFIVGILTGFHCVSMCGGFVVSYTAKDAKDGVKSHKSHVMYGLGKTISYTMFGALFGLLGSMIAFTPKIRAVAGILAGMFLVLFGLKMLNIISALRKFQFRLPGFISKVIGEKRKKHSSPLIIGLLNGLMIACGPLQAIYIMAAGTGSMLEGAKLLFVFALGTLPVMLGFGYFASFVSGKMTHKILKASGVVVIILGLLMVNNGLVLAGTGYDFRSVLDSLSAESGTVSSSAGWGNGDGFQEIRMNVDRYGWSPDKFVLKAGVPVRWIITGKEITGCNNAIQVPEYGLKFDIKKGEQVIEFTPDKVGTVRWSCWMGMIPGTFIVKDDVDLQDTLTIEQELDKLPVQPKGSCGGSCGGGCGCGCGG